MKSTNPRWSSKQYHPTPKQGQGPQGGHNARFKAGELVDETPAVPSFALPAIGEGPLTMSSREIAELTGKQHKNVLRDIQRMLEDLEIDEKDGSVLSHQGISKAYDGRGYVSTFGLPKDLTICLVAGYDAKLRLAIIRRWEELETAAKEPQTAAEGADLSRVLALLAELTVKVDALSLAKAPETLALAAPERSPSFPLFIPLAQPLRPHALPLSEHYQAK